MVPGRSKSARPGRCPKELLGIFAEEWTLAAQQTGQGAGWKRPGKPTRIPGKPEIPYVSMIGKELMGL
jgi:hypothetical protein